MDPNFSRRNVFLYHDNPGEGPLLVAAVKFIEKSCNINLSHIKVREVQYAKPLLVILCPVVNKTDLDVNALLDSSRDGRDVLLVMIKRAVEHSKNKDSLNHLKDPISTSTRNRVGAACTIFFSGKEKFKGYKNENGLAVNEIKRVVNHSLDRKPWATHFPVGQSGDQVDGTSSTAAPQNDPRPIQFVQSTQQEHAQPIQVFQPSQQPQHVRPVPHVQSIQQTQPIPEIVLTPPSQPAPAVDPFQAAPAQQTVVQPGQPTQAVDPFQTAGIPPTQAVDPFMTAGTQPNQVVDPFHTGTQPTQAVDPFQTAGTQPVLGAVDKFDDFFDLRGNSSNKGSGDPFADAFSTPPPETPANLNFPPPTPALKDVRSPVFYFFDDTSPLEQDTVHFIEEHGKFQLKACRRQTAAVVSPLVVFSPCYTMPDADAKSVLGHSRDGEDVFLVIVEPVYSHKPKKQASISESVQTKIGAYGVLSYSLDTKTYDNTKPNIEMVTKLRDFIQQIQSLAEDDDDDDDEEEEEPPSNILILEGFHDLGFDESDA
ncbi:uncharacterized protein LOC124142884 [Haliotis rufescens]|uniref:uncharacterized protein LOC124142884 n=1 Tax=Haliotis rufescens TaxID=6454 RepID=UPI00201E797D|nr:uncharacterized protein LOC124142884 [Haliotis rufescens]